jgi:hypothetical protein
LASLVISSGNGICRKRWITSGNPSYTMLISVPTDTGFRSTITRISPGQVRVVDPIGILQRLGRLQLAVFAAEGMALPRREVRERHPERAADLRFKVMHFASGPVRWKPARHGVRLDE